MRYGLFGKPEGIDAFWMAAAISDLDDRAE
jgi:hypothetical protein